MKVIAFSPHPDDVEILCSGTLAKYASQGHDVAIAYVTNGNVGSPTLSLAETAATREREARASCAVIGAKCFWMGYDDEFLYDAPEVRRHFIDVLREFQPDLVLGPDKDHDYHTDHIRTGHILWDTQIMTTVPNIATAHGPCGHHAELWFFDTIAGLNFLPEFYVDITDHWETKKRMIESHASQNDWLMDQYGLTAVYYGETQSRFRGFQTGCPFAEAFRRPQMMPQSVAKNALLPCGRDL